MASRSRRGPGAAQTKPVSQATRWSQGQQRARLTRVLVVLGALALVVIPQILPLLPDKLGNWAWKKVLWNAFGPMLLFPIPKAGYPPLLQWVYWVAAAAGAFFCASLILHWTAIRTQMIAPLRHERSYIRLRVPSDAAITGQRDGTTLVAQLAALLPARNLLQGDPVPAVLRWTGRRELPALQGVSVAGDKTFRETIIRMLQGVTERSEATVQADPLLAALSDENNPDAVRWVAWCDVRLAASDAFPIFIPRDTESPLVETLLPALAPQSGVIVSDMQLMVSGHKSRNWRNKVLAQLESMKIDTGSTEQRMLKAKADGPALEVAVRLLAVADSAEAGTGMVRTMSGALARSSQGYGMVQQQLVAGPVQALPTRLPEPKIVSTRTRLICWLVWVGVAAGLWALLWMQRWPLGGLQGLVWGTPLAALALPSAILGLLDQRAGLEQYRLLKRVLGSVPPAQNPRVVPLFSD